MISRPHPHDLIRLLADASPTADAAPVIATIWSAEGSTPLDEGARAHIDADGLRAGTVGGGAAEAETLRTAPDVRRQGSPRLLVFDLQGPGGEQPDPICGGHLRILLEPLSPDLHLAFSQAAAALAERRRGLLHTTLFTHPDHTVSTSTRWIAADHLDTLPASLLAPARDCLERGLLYRGSHPDPSGEPLEVLLEPVVPRPALLIIGGGHVGQALAAQAVLVGFEISVLDERPDFLEPAAFPPGTRFLTDSLRVALDRFPFAPDTHVAVMTRGHLLDAEAIAACLGRPAAYLGMIGSRRKVTLLRDRLLATGQTTPEQWRRVHTPIGLDLGALTAPEIAASIVAELIAVRRRGTSPRLWQPAP